MIRAPWSLAIAALIGCTAAVDEAAPDTDEAAPDTDEGTADTDDAGPPALGPDVEGVAFREVGLTLTVATANGDAEAALDVNGDGVDDFDLELGRSTEDGVATNRYAAFGALVEGNELLVGEVPNPGQDGGTYEAVRSLALGERVEGASVRWSSSGLLHEIETAGDVVEEDYGVAGDGRVLLGVRFVSGTSDLLNGWIEVSVDDEVTTVSVHRAGWAERPEVGVGAGDR